MPVVNPADTVTAGLEGNNAETCSLGKAGCKSSGLHGMNLLPLVIGVPVHAPDTIHQCSGRRSARPVRQTGIGGAGLAINVSVSSGIDNHFGKDGFSPFFALKNYALNYIIFYNGLGHPAVVANLNCIPLLINHLIHGDLQLIGLIMDGAHQTFFLGSLIIAAAGAIQK